MPPPSRARWGYPITTPPRPFGVRPALSRRGSTRREGSQGPPPIHHRSRPTSVRGVKSATRTVLTHSGGHSARVPRGIGPSGTLGRQRGDPPRGGESSSRPPVDHLLLVLGVGRAQLASRPHLIFPTPFIQRTAQVPTSGWPFRNAPPPPGGRGSRNIFARSATVHVPWAD